MQGPLELCPICSNAQATNPCGDCSYNMCRSCRIRLDLCPQCRIPLNPLLQWESLPEDILQFTRANELPQVESGRLVVHTDEFMTKHLAVVFQNGTSIQVTQSNFNVLRIWDLIRELESNSVVKTFICEKIWE